MTKTTLTILAAASVAIGSLRVSAAPKARLDGAYVNEFKLTRITPHLEFARPAGWAPPKVLLVTPWFLATREVAELAQRLDMQADVITVPSEKQFAVTSGHALTIKGVTAEEKTAEILAVLSRGHDAIVLGNFQYTALPEQVQAEIERRVRDGTGLLLVFQHELPPGMEAELQEHAETGQRDWIWQNVPLADLPYFPGRWHVPPAPEELGTFRLGKGRVARIHYPKPHLDVHNSAAHGGPSLTPPVPFNYRLPTLYRGLLSLPARAMLWCARCVPSATLAVCSPIVSASTTATVTATVSTPEPFTGTLAMLVRDEYGRFPLRLHQQLTLKAGDSPVRFELPELHAGRFFAELWLRRDGKTVDWATVALRVGNPILSYTAMKKCWLAQPRVVDVGQALEHVFELGRPLRDRETLALWLKDAHDRVLQRLPASVTGTQVALAFTVPAGQSHVLRPEWVVRNGERLVESFQTPTWQYYVRPPSRSKFHFVLWGQINSGMLGYQAYDAFRDIGMDTVLYVPRNGHYHAPLLKAMGLLYVPYIYRMRFYPSKDGRYTHQFPFDSWLHPEDRDGITEFCRQVAQGYGLDTGSTVLSYTLGDEPFLGGRDVCFRDWWMPAFRDYLRAEYGSIDQLNRVWLTEYESFDHVEPRTSSQVKTQAQFIEKAEAGDRCWDRPPEGNRVTHSYAPYVDHRRFVTRTLPGMVTALQNAIASIEPGARLGFEGAGNIEAYYGTDLPELARTMGQFVPYWNRAVHDIVRSFRSDRLIQGTWFGGYTGGRLAHTGRGNSTMWESVFSGANSLWFFCTAGTMGGLNLDLSLAPYVAADDIKRLAADGLGEWLASATIEEDPIAIHYSVASNDVIQFEYPWGYMGNVHQSWLYLLNDLGYTPGFVDQVALERGDLNHGKVRLLILPNSVALSVREAQEIRGFAERGGTVIADLRPGVLNHHGGYLQSGQLDDLFGIQRATTKRGTKVQRVAVDLSQPRPYLALSETDTDPTVRTTTGKGALLPDGTPVVIENRARRGRTVLLNFNVYPFFPGRYDSRFGKRPPPKHTEGLAELIGGYCTRSGIAPRCALTRSDGKDTRGSRRAWFAGADAAVVGVLSTPYGVETDALGYTVVQDLAGAAAGKREATVQLDRRYWVCDVMRGQLLGRTDHVTGTIQPESPLLLALLKRQPEAPELSLSTDTAQPGTNLTVTVRTPHLSRALVLLELHDPQGRLCRWSRRLLWTEDGEATHELRFALNEPPGAYRLTATHVLTERRHAATVEVTKAAAPFPTPQPLD